MAVPSRGDKLCMPGYTPRLWRTALPSGAPRPSAIGLMIRGREPRFPSRGHRPRSHLRVSPPEINPQIPAPVPAFAPLPAPLAADPALGSGIDKGNFDPDVRPQDDLFRHVNGQWLKEAKIPA